MKKEKSLKISPFLTNYGLEGFINILDIEKERKNLLLSEISGLNKEERIDFFALLKDIYFIDLREKEALEKLKG